MWFEASSSRPVLGEESNPHLVTPWIQGFVGIKSSPVREQTDMWWTWPHGKDFVIRVKTEHWTHRYRCLCGHGNAPSHENTLRKSMREVGSGMGPQLMRSGKRKGCHVKAARRKRLSCKSSRTEQWNYTWGSFTVPSPFSIFSVWWLHHSGHRGGTDNSNKKSNYSVCSSRW